jgi:mRNA-degrading endonuclease RelE of RelBE toxin-antitoxin system
MYSVLYHGDIEKRLLKLSSKIVEDFRNAVLLLQQNPFPPHPKIKKLHKPLEGYRYKMHPFRITYTVNTETKTVYIYDLFHRGRGYRS